MFGFKAPRVFMAEPAEGVTGVEGAVSDEQAFVAAFDKSRSTLAAFAKCQSKRELGAVRDGFMLSLGSSLCPAEYATVDREGSNNYYLKCINNIHIVETVLSSGRACRYLRVRQVCVGCARPLAANRAVAHVADSAAAKRGSTAPAPPLAPCSYGSLD